MELDQRRTTASFVQRVRAFLYDYLVIAVYLIALVGVGAVLGGVYPSAAARLFASPVQSQVVVFCLLTLPVVLYFALQESSLARATWGKRKIGLTVAGERGERVTFARALLRAMVKFVPWEFAHTVIWQISAADDPSSPAYTLGFVLVWLLVAVYVVGGWVSPSRRTLYDRISGTVVVVGADPN